VTAEHARLLFAQSCRTKPRRAGERDALIPFTGQWARLERDASALPDSTPAARAGALRFWRMSTARNCEQCWNKDLRHSTGVSRGIPMQVQASGSPMC